MDDHFFYLHRTFAFAFTMCYFVILPHVLTRLLYLSTLYDDCRPSPPLFASGIAPQKILQCPVFGQKTRQFAFI